MNSTCADMCTGLDFNELQRQLSLLSMFPNTMPCGALGGGLPAAGGGLVVPHENDTIAAFWDQMCRQQQLLSAASMLVNGGGRQAYPTDALLPALASLTSAQESEQASHKRFPYLIQNQPPSTKKTGHKDKRKIQTKKKNERREKGSICFVQHEDARRKHVQGVELIEKFKDAKGRGFLLQDLFGNLVSFARDQAGSRFLQNTLPNANKDEFIRAFDEIMPHADSLIVHVFGNYVIQKLLERGSAQQRRNISKCIEGRMLQMSMQVYGCRVIQKGMDYLDITLLEDLAQELKGHVSKCTLDLNGNHVIQKCVERLPEEKIQFILDDVVAEVASLTTHQYGCRVLQRIMERPTYTKHKGFIAKAALKDILELSKNPYGNYVVQHVLEYGSIEDRSHAIAFLVPYMTELSRHKFASNVIEKCLLLSSPAERKVILEAIIGKTQDENRTENGLQEEKLPWHDLIIDQFGNYVIQRALEVMNGKERGEMLSQISEYLRSLKRAVYGEHVFKRVEKVLGHPSSKSSTIQVVHS